MDAHVWVRCPHCREEFPVADVVQDLPPRLEVVAERTVTIGPAGQKQSVSGASRDPAVSAEETDEYALIVADATAPAESLSGEDMEELSGLDESKANVRSPQTLHARRTKQTSQNLIAMLKVVMGGLAGLALGQAIIWWLPVPYQSDPLDLAGRVPTSLQFILPPNLRAAEYGESPDESVETVGRVVPKYETSSDDQGRPLQSLTRSEGSVAPSNASQASTSTATTGEQPAGLGKDIVPPTDLRICLGTAMAEDLVFHGEPQRLKAWNAALRQLAHCATNIQSLDEVNTSVVEGVTEFLRSLMQDEAKTALIAQTASEQIAANPPRSWEGIVVVGNVEKVQSAGELHETTLVCRKSDGSSMRVAVVSRKDPLASKTFHVHDEVLILGVLIVDPNTELQGYKGPAQPVVWGGFPVRHSRLMTTLIDR